MTALLKPVANVPPRLSDVLQVLRIGNHNPRPPERDEWYTTTCPSCGVEQRLDEAVFVELNDHASAYYCRDGCDEPPILLIEARGGQWEDERDRGEVGIRFAEWILRNPCDVFLHTPAAKKPTRLRACPAALAPARAPLTA